MISGPYDNKLENADTLDQNIDFSQLWPLIDTEIFDSRTTDIARAVSQSGVIITYPMYMLCTFTLIDFKEVSYSRYIDTTIYIEWHTVYTHCISFSR